MKQYIVIICLLTSLNVLGQTAEVPRQSFIEVVGTASKQILPDRIFISIILKDKIVGDKPYNITEQEDRLKEVLKTCDIDLSNLALTDATSGIVTGKRREAVMISKTYMLQVKNVNEVAKVFKELTAVDIKEYAIQKSENSQIENSRKEVRIAAIKAAKDKAGYLLAAIDEQLDVPIEIKEIEDVSQFARSAMGNVYVTNTQLSDAEHKKSEVDFQKIEVRYSYYIRYAIKGR